MTQNWRLIFDSPLDGASNMARDQAIQEAVGANLAPPTLRFYAWNPPCLSLGYNQALAEVELANLQAHHWQLVRRATGGKAILHTDELTYSVTLPQDHPIVAGGILESYRRLSGALLIGLEALGVQPQSVAKDKSLLEGPVCFEVPSNYEITANGHKLIGSAQVRRHNAVLQHGSLPLTGDIARICDALHFPDEHERHAAKIRVRERAITLADTLGHLLDWQSVATALAQAFAQTFTISLTASELSPEEQDRAAMIRQEIYTDAEWLARR